MYEKAILIKTKKKKKEKFTHTKKTLSKKFLVN